MTFKNIHCKLPFENSFLVTHHQALVLHKVLVAHMQSTTTFCVLPFFPCCCVPTPIWEIILHNSNIYYVSFNEYSFISSCSLECWKEHQKIECCKPDLVISNTNEKDSSITLQPFLAPTDDTVPPDCLEKLSKKYCIFCIIKCFLYLPQKS